MSGYKYQDNVKCPFCDYIHNGSYEFLSTHSSDGDTIIIDCDNCGKEIEVTIHISAQYSSSIYCPGHEFELSDFEGFLISDELLKEKELSLYCHVCKETIYEWSLPGGKYARIKEGTFKYIGRAKKILELRQATKSEQNVINKNLSNEVRE